MYSYDIEWVIQKIEKETRNELNMFLQFGDAYFTLEAIKKMLYRQEKNARLYNNLFSISVVLGASSFLWIPGSILLAISGMEYLFLPIVSLFPLCFIIGLAGCCILQYKFGCMDYQQYVISRLRQAIQTKRKCKD